eukprot:scaffold1600_cov179-Amphora_coffeaeformis.AAC.1
MVLHHIEDAFRKFLLPITGKRVGFAEHRNQAYETEPRSLEEFHDTWYTKEETVRFQDQTNNLKDELMQKDPRAKVLVEMFMDFKSQQVVGDYSLPAEFPNLSEDLLGLTMSLLPPCPRKKLLKQMKRYTSLRHATVQGRMDKISRVVSHESRPSQIYARYCAMAALKA